MQTAEQRMDLVMTSRFGEVEVDPERVLTMRPPLWGFPRSSRFFLHSHSGSSPLMWLQSVDEAELAFVVVPPAALRPDYRPEIGPQLRDELAITDDRDMDILLILTVPAGRPEKMTANLLAPIVINVSKRIGRQILLDPRCYDPCWPVFG